MKILFSSYGIFDEQRKIGPIQWPHLDLLYIHQGSIELCINDDVLILAQDQAIIIFPSNIFSGHSLTKTSQGSVHHFQLDKSDSQLKGLEYLFDKENIRKGYILIDTRATPTLHQYINHSLDLENQVQDTVVEAAQYHCLSLFLLLSHTENTSTSSGKNVHSPEQKVADFLAKDLTSNYSLEDVANLVHLSPSHVRRLFKKRYNVGPHKFHTQLKMAKARKLLCESNEPIKSIYQSLGFSDLSNFYRVFRHYTGVPPACYRKESQGSAQADVNDEHSLSSLL